MKERDSFSSEILVGKSVTLDIWLLGVSCLNLSACFCELRWKDLGIQLGSGKKEALLG